MAGQTVWFPARSSALILACAHKVDQFKNNLTASSSPKFGDLSDPSRTAISSLMVRSKREY